MNNIKILQAIIVALFTILSFIVYQFVTGSVVNSIDDRVAIPLTKAERIFVLSGMRNALSNIKTISQAITEKDLKTVEKTARTAALTLKARTPATIMQKLPLGMKKLGLEMHDKFDEIANNANANVQTIELRQQLDELLTNCVNCHNAYKLVKSK